MLLKCVTYLVPQAAVAPLLAVSSPPRHVRVSTAPHSHRSSSKAAAQTFAGQPRVSGT